MEKNVHRFRLLETSARFKEVKHYEKTTSTPFNSYIEDFANISLQRHFNKSQNVAYWYKSAPRKKDDTRGAWDKHPVTGLFRTQHPQIYYGDVSKWINGYIKKHTLLLFCFSRDMKEMVIFEYKDYYPSLYDFEQFVTSEMISILSLNKLIN